MLHGCFFGRFQPAPSEYTDEEVALHYDEFYEDVHTEFLKFGELVNFKVCGNASAHLRGNVYVHYQSLDSAIAAYNAINGRFFAGKQITCEFIGVTRWKVAICGEYMKSRHKNCSHGSACNFLHCFRNPGGEYEWADWDNPPPRSWMIKMDMLFGGSRITQYDNHKLRERDNRNSHGYSNRSSCRRSSRQHKLRERDCWSSDDNETKYKEHTTRKYSSKEERDTRSDSDQASDVYNRKANKRRPSHNRGASDKTRRGESEMSEEDNEITDRSHRRTDRSMHVMNKKRHHRDHSCEDDTGDRKKRADSVDSDRTSKKHSESRRGSCVRLDDDHNVVKYKSKDTRSDSDQDSDVYNRKANKIRCSQNRGASDKTKRGENEMSEEDKEITDRAHQRTDRSMHRMNRKRHHREQSCEDDTNDKKRRADSVDSDLTGKKHSDSRRGSCVRLDDDHNVVKYKSKDRLTFEREDGLQSSRSEKKKRSRESRRSQDHVKESMDQEKMKLSRGNHSSKSPRKNRERERLQRWHGDHKSPRRVKNYYQSQGRDQGKSLSPEKDQHRSKLLKRSRNFSRTPKSSEEDSLDDVDRWQASDDSVI